MSNKNDTPKFIVVDAIPTIEKGNKSSHWDDTLAFIANELPNGKHVMLSFDDNKTCAIKSSILRGLITRRGLSIGLSKRGNDLYLFKK